jgi:lipocalin
MYQQSNQSNRTNQNKHMIDTMSNYMLTNKNMINYLNKCVKMEKKKKEKNVAIYFF